MLLDRFAPALVAAFALAPALALAAAPDTLAQEAYIKASNSTNGTVNGFGGAIALDGDTLVVSQIGDDSNASGVNGNQFNEGAPNSGAVFVYVKSGGTWVQQAYLKASNPAASNSFGSSLALDGDTLVIGSTGQDTSGSNSGAAYVFTRTAGVWSQQAFLKASNPGASDAFGRSIDVDGDTVVVGAPNEDSNALGVGGSQTDNSSANSGAAYVFVRNGASWSQQAYVKASNTQPDDQFGFSVAIVGDTVVVGAVNEDSNATGVNGAQSNNSQSQAGAAYVFTRSGVAWSQQAYLKASNTDNNDQFGIALAMDGETLVVGSAGEASGSPGVNGVQLDESQQDAGAAYVFVRTGGVWAQEAYVKASNPGADDLFGIDVALHGDTLVVGAFHENSSATGVDGNQADESADDAGAAYVFRRNGSTWSQQAYLKASNTQLGDVFGGACAVFGDAIVCSAIGESSNATGVNGDQSNDLAPQAGACYAFVIEPNSFTTLSGCFAINTAALTSTSPGLELGQAALLDLSAGLYPSGLALLYYGVDGTNDFGCGVALPGFGELLLGLVPSPVNLATSIVTLGTGQFVVNVPNNPSFVGIEVAFQAVNVDLGGAGVELSNALMSTIAP
jgi:hypothetical protein